MNSLSIIIAENIKHLCSQQKKSLGELEHEIGVCKGYLSRVKNGKTEISVDKVYMASLILDTSICDLCVDIRLKELRHNAELYGYKLVPILEG